MNTDNKFYLYLGLGLPICLLLIFLALTLIGNSIKPPKNKVLFVERSLNLKFKVINNQIKITKDTTDGGYTTDQRLPTIIVFDPDSKAITKYKTSKDKSGLLLLADFPKQLKIDTALLANDQYTFICNPSDALLYRLLNTQGHCVLYKKYFKTITVPNSNSDSIFLGWIIND